MILKCSSLSTLRHLRFSVISCQVIVSSIIIRKSRQYLEDLVEVDLVVLPLLAELDDEDPTAVLIAIRQHREDVVLEDIALFARLQIVVHVGVLHLEAVVVLHELEGRVRVVLAGPQEPDQPGFVVEGALQVGFRWNMR